MTDPLRSEHATGSARDDVDEGFSTRQRDKSQRAHPELRTTRDPHDSIEIDIEVGAGAPRHYGTLDMR